MRTLRLLLSLVGAVLVALAPVDRWDLAARPPEKAAYYFLEHWWDRVWEIQLPLLAGGIVLLVAGLCRGRRGPG
jgi:hypothetical protein